MSKEFSVLHECNDILQWWRNQKLEFPALSALARNTVCAMAPSAVSQQCLAQS